MAFDPTRFKVALDGGVGGGALRIHTLYTGDSIETLLSAGYLTRVGDRGLRVGDMVAVQIDGSGLLYTMSIAAINAAGNATLQIVMDPAIPAAIAAALADPVRIKAMLDAFRAAIPVLPADDASIPDAGGWFSVPSGFTYVPPKT